MSTKNQEVILKGDMDKLFDKENHEDTQIAAINSPDSLLEIAVQKGTDLAQLEKLMDLKERYDAGIAKKFFYSSMAMFQANCPSIIKKKVGHNYKYAPLGDIAEQIRKPLQEAGLSYRFEMEHGEIITVTCIVTHIDGHNEKATMSAPPDESGSLAGIQSRASTVTYLQRYTLISALGLTTADEDMDGRLPQETITDEQEADLNSLIDEVDANKSQFLKMLKVEKLSDLPTTRYEGAIKRLQDKAKS